MKPRQLFLGNPGHLGEGEEPAAWPLEGVGGAAGTIRRAAHSPPSPRSAHGGGAGSVTWMGARWESYPFGL